MANSPKLEQYREHRIYEHRDGALLLRVCFQRLSDGQFATAMTEFIREGDDLPKRLADISLNITELLLDPEQPDLWDFFPSPEEAIADHDRAFADFDSWIPNAQD